MLTCQWYLFNPARFTGSTTLSCSRRWRIYQTCVHSEPMCVLIEEEWFYKLILLSHPHRSCHSMAEIVTVTLKTAKSSSNVGQSSFYFVIRFLSVFADVQGVASVTSISSLGHLRKSIITVKRAVTDATMKDILKKMRGNILIRHCLFSVHQLRYVLKNCTSQDFVLLLI